MNETRYEINWHSVDDAFSHCTVTPITVIREGVLPGCTGISITAIGSDRGRFQGSPDDYFKTEAEAWAKVKSDLEKAVKENAKQAREQERLVLKMRAYLEQLK